MTDGHAYRLETAEQLEFCLQIAVPERLWLSADSAENFAQLPIGTPNLAISAEAELAWIDATGAVRRDDSCAGALTGPAKRMLFDRRRIWILTEEALHRIDSGTLQLLDSSARDDILDIAGDGAGGAWLLRPENIRRVDANGREQCSRPIERTAGENIAIAGNTIALLSMPRNTLTLVGADQTLEVDLDDVLDDAAGRFAADALSSSGRGLLLSGKWGDRHGVLMLDDKGGPSAWGTWEGTPPETALAAGGDLFAVLVENGRWIIRRFAGAAEAGGLRLLTPPLESDNLAGNWLRADITALLPDRSTMTLRYASTNKEALRDTAERIARDERISVGARMGTIRDILDWSDVARTYAGRTVDPMEPEDFAFPLHEARGHIVWVELTLCRNHAVVHPQLHRVIVHHDAPSLMDNLPAVYRTPDGDRDLLMRRLISVVETTTQDLDERIGRLGDRLDPQRTDERWLPALASLLGLPFHAALEPQTQRNVLLAAPRILAGRGTRNGVVALLGALFPDRPFRVVDLTEQLTPIMVGGGGTPGASLPAFLSGPSTKVPRLNARLVLGRTGLCHATPCDSRSVIGAPELLVEIAASPREQRRLAAAVRHMIEAILPAGVQLRLRWVTGARGTGEPVTFIREPKPMVLGEATSIRGIRIGGDRKPRLRNGIPVGHRLQ